MEGFAVERMRCRLDWKSGGLGCKSTALVKAQARQLISNDPSTLSSQHLHRFISSIEFSIPSIAIKIRA